MRRHFHGKGGAVPYFTYISAGEMTSFLHLSQLTFLTPFRPESSQRLPRDGKCIPAVRLGFFCKGRPAVLLPEVDPQVPRAAVNRHLDIASASPPGASKRRVHRCMVTWYDALRAGILSGQILETWTRSGWE